MIAKNLWTLLHLFIALFTSLSLQVNKYAKELLAAMSSGMEEKDDPGDSRVLSCSLNLLIYCSNSLSLQSAGLIFPSLLLISGLWSSCR